MNTEEIFTFFKANHEGLYLRYPGKFLVLSNNDVAFAKESFEEALDAALSSGLKPGEFLVQECTEGDRAYTQFFSNLAVFS